uniref:Uncharacterized protein n=1 Tax=Fagus sylvatica TaxID=28930 RepID=A0A2N9IQ21_FAGSY
MTQIPRCEMHHAYREANRVADALARIGCFQSDAFVLYDYPPAQVDVLLELDVSELTPEFEEEPAFGVRDFSITGFGTTKMEISQFPWDLLLFSFGSVSLSLCSPSSDSRSLFSHSSSGSAESSSASSEDFEDNGVRVFLEEWVMRWGLRGNFGKRGG